MEIVVVVGMFLLAIAYTLRPGRIERAERAERAERTISEADIQRIAANEMDRTTLLVCVKHYDDGSVSTSLIGAPLNMQDVAHAAAYCTGIAAQNCPDGFEKGMEYIQEDAIRIAMAESVDDAAD